VPTHLAVEDLKDETNVETKAPDVEREQRWPVRDFPY